MMRQRVEGSFHAALRENAVAHVVAHLKGGNPRDLRGKGQHLQVEHQLDVLFPRVRHAQGSGNQLSFLRGGVTFLYGLDSPLHIANIRAKLLHPPHVAGAEHGLKPCRVFRRAVENASGAGWTSGPE